VLGSARVEECAKAAPGFEPPEPKPPGEQVNIKHCYLAAQYYRLAARWGRKRALIAVAHSILVSVYHLPMLQQNYAELREGYFTGRDS
jgi:hypothetical protein